MGIRHVLARLSGEAVAGSREGPGGWGILQKDQGQFAYTMDLYSLHSSRGHIAIACLILMLKTQRNGRRLRVGVRP